MLLLLPLKVFLLIFKELFLPGYRSSTRKGDPPQISGLQVQAQGMADADFIAKTLLEIR